MSTELVPQLSEIAERRYQKLKKQIRTWWDDRLKIGKALEEIRDGKLYQKDYSTFEDFCQAEYGIKHSQAYRLIEAAQVKDTVSASPIGERLTNEGQARALAAVPEKQREEVLAKAAETGKVTAKSINAAAEAVTPKSAKTEKPIKTIRLDKTGYPIPDSILVDWLIAEAFSDTLRDLHQIKLQVEKAIDAQDLAFREITNTTSASLKNAWSDLQRVLPHAVCTTCQGHNRKTCTLCKGRGYMSKFGYEHWVPKEMRDLREKGARK